MTSSSQPNTTLDISIITSWHAHVYFDAETRNNAWTLRETIAKHIGNKLEIGRFSEV
jgi:aromatic ring-cleaving dioxygenase